MDALQFHQPVIVKAGALHPPVLRNNLVVLHSFYSCDTMLKFFAHPSYKALTMSSAHPAAELMLFKNRNWRYSEIHKAGSKQVAAMYKCDQDLSSERLRLFKIKCSSKTSKRDYPLRQMLRITTAKEHSSQHRTCLASRITHCSTDGGLKMGCCSQSR